MAWGSLLLCRAISVWEGKYEKKGKKRKEKNPHHREDLLGLPSWDIITAIARDPCQSFTKKNYQEKYITFS